VQLNQGGGGTWARAIAQHTPVADASLRFDFRRPLNNNTADFRVFLRASGDWATSGPSFPTSAYAFTLHCDRDSFELEQISGGVLTPLYSGLWDSAADTDWHSARFEVVGDQVRSRVWDQGAAEPQTWDWELTNTVVTGPGVLQLELNRSKNLHEFQLDNFILIAP